MNVRFVGGPWHNRHVEVKSGADGELPNCLSVPISEAGYVDYELCSMQLQLTDGRPDGIDFLEYHCDLNENLASGETGTSFCPIKSRFRVIEDSFVRRLRAIQ